MMDVETAGKAVGVLLVGGGVVFVGIKAYRAISAGLANLPKIPDIGPIISSREYTAETGQKCREEVGPFGKKTECGPVPEPSEVKKSSRSERLKWWIDHPGTDPAAALDALKAEGNDPNLEREIFLLAAMHQQSVSHLIAIGHASLNDQDLAYQEILRWWAMTRGDDRARKAAEANDMRGLVGVAADFCDVSPPKGWNAKDCADLRSYAGGS